MEHKYFICKCNQVGCQFCDGGLGLCDICGAFEGQLLPECPGRALTQEELEESYRALHDENRRGVLLLKYQMEVPGVSPKPITHARDAEIAANLGRLNYEEVSRRVIELIQGSKDNIVNRLHAWDDLTDEHRAAWVEGARRVLVFKR